MKIVESRGFTEAAKKLGLSVASISMHMAQMESTLGVSLCSRGRAGFSLTPEGERIHEACQALQVAHENFESEVGKVRGELTGELHLGVIDNAVYDPNLNIPSLVSRFNRIAPQVLLSLHTLSPPELERGIMDQRLHLAIGAFYDRFNGIEYIPLCTERLTLYCGELHPLFNKKRISPENLNECAFVERTYATTLKRTNQNLNITPVAYTSSLEAALLMILSGRYLGFLPEYYAQTWINSGKITPLLKNALFVESEILAIRNKNPVNKLLTGTLLDLLVPPASGH